MNEKQTATAESTAVRVALWRAMHVQVDPPPHVLEDEIGFKLVAPDDGWRRRPDMDPQSTRLFRASIVARARFIDDLVMQQFGRGIYQYVILGAGLDTFVQRIPEIASGMRIFEVDQPGPQAWKRERLIELGFGIPECLRLVPVDFEAGDSWLKQLKSAGFDTSRPAIVSSTGVTMYLTKDAIAATLRQIALFAPGSTLAMTYILPIEFAEAQERAVFEAAEKGARASGTPFLSFFTSSDMSTLASEAGFKEVRTESIATLTERYFVERNDDFRPGSSEALLIATT